MTATQSDSSDADISYPSDVENALTLLRHCLNDLGIEIDREHDNALQWMIEENLRHTNLRVATDEQLRFERDLVSQVECSRQQGHWSALRELAASARVRGNKDDDCFSL